MTVLPHQSSLSREERERIRRAAQIWTEDESQNQRTSRLEKEVLALCAALEQAERERDEAHSRLLTEEDLHRKTERQSLIRIGAAEARLATVPALVEAAVELLDYYQNAEAKRSTDRLIELEDALSEAVAAWEAE